MFLLEIKKKVTGYFPNSRFTFNYELLLICVRETDFRQEKLFFVRENNSKMSGNFIFNFPLEAFYYVSLIA